MKILTVKKIFLIVLLSLFAIFWLVYPYNYLNDIPSSIILNESDIESFCNDKKLNGIVKGQYTQSSVPTSTNYSNIKNGVIEYKLFNLFSLKKVNIVEVSEDEIYACGKMVGITLQSKGVVIIGANPNGANLESFKATNELQVGDIISEIEGEEIVNAKSIETIINKDEYQGKELVVKCKRKDQNFWTTLKPAKDLQTKTYKLGYWVRDDASGIGTVTYIRPDNLRFGALGHPISDLDTGTTLDVYDGKLYKCNILSVQKGEQGQAGEVRGLFMQNSNYIGMVEKNNKFGIYGNIYEGSALMEDCKLLKIGGRMTAKPGKASILCSLDGKNTKEYDIEIVKTNYQSTSNTKSMVIKVTDKELIKATGGIVQGMSGSPIIQNGRLIGAVTHVFVNDPTRGFGVYLDWMIEN